MNFNKFGWQAFLKKSFDNCWQCYFWGRGTKMSKFFVLVCPSFMQKGKIIESTIEKWKLLGNENLKISMIPCMLKCLYTFYVNTLLFMILKRKGWGKGGIFSLTWPQWPQWAQWPVNFKRLSTYHRKHKSIGNHIFTNKIAQFKRNLIFWANEPIQFILGDYLLTPKIFDSYFVKIWPNTS